METVSYTTSYLESTLILFGNNSLDSKQKSRTFCLFCDHLVMRKYHKHQGKYVGNYLLQAT